MINHKAIRLAFRNKFLSIPGVDQDRVAFENRDFNPDNVVTGSPAEKDAGRIWFRETYLKNTESLDSTNLIGQTAIMQYDVFCLAGRGTEAAELLQLAIADTFKPTTTLGDGVGNSIEERLSDAIDTRLALSTVKPIFSTQDHTNGVYIPDLTCWARTVDKTAISPWSSGAGANGASIAITPQHLLCVTDYAHSGYVRHITQDGNTVTRLITGTSVVSGTDLHVSKLDRPLPESITPAKILPDNWATYISDAGEGLPLLRTDGEEKALVSDIDVIASDFYFKTPADASRLAAHEAFSSGDQGNPICLVYNNELIVLALLSTAANGSSCFHFRNGIKTAINTLGGGFELKPADFASSVQIDIDKTTSMAGRDAGTLMTSKNRWYQFPVSIEFRSYTENKGEYL